MRGESRGGILLNTSPVSGSSFRKTAATLLSVAVIMMAGACIFPHRAAVPDDAPNDPSNEVVSVSVENQNFYDATIYTVHGTTRERLGNVGGQGHENFSFKWKAGEVYFIIALLAVGEYPTERISVSPGDQLELTVEPTLHKRIAR